MAAILDLALIASPLVPAYLYTKEQKNGLIKGAAISFVLQLVLNFLIIKKLKKEGKVVSSSVELTTGVLLGMAVGGGSLGYVMHEQEKTKEALATGIVLGAGIFLLSDAIALKVADKVAK